MRASVEAYLEQYGLSFLEKRLRADITQLQLARLLNISQAIISHIETGHMLPPKEIEDALLEILGEGELCE